MMNNPLKKVLSAYRVDYPKRLTYMWQASEYSIKRLLRWWVSVDSFSTFARRGDLVLTYFSRILRILIVGIAVAYWVVNLLILIYTITEPLQTVIYFCITALLYPLTVVLLSIVPITILKLIKNPLDSRNYRQAKRLYADHRGIIIAVAGSYGKTSMKEILAKVLGAGDKKVRFTEGNRNTLNSLATFATELDGHEEFVIVEFGEGAPGDIDRMTKLTSPDYALITGLAPNHLDQYKTVENIVDDLNSLIKSVAPKNIYINGDNESLSAITNSPVNFYGNAGCAGWKVAQLHIDIDRLQFTALKKGTTIDINAGLIGRHNIGPIMAVIALAEQLGLSIGSIQESITKLKPYEHRMEPRRIDGAWMIDDTYNGNIEGMLAGLDYLAEIKVTGRKIYATPGLVDQGDENEAVHTKLGAAIAQCSPDQVYLMKNSVQPIILRAMEKAGYDGRVTIVDDPLNFYVHIQDVLATGDVILCQNDWPDVYY